MKYSRETITALLASLCAVVFLRVLNHFAGTAVYHCFAFPSSIAAAFFYNAEVTVHNGIYCISDTRLVLHITRQCSAFSFFSILFSLLLFEYMRYGNKGRYLLLVSILPFSYVMTVIANAVRIILWRAVYPLVVSILPVNLIALAHQFVGVTVFLPLLCAVYLFAEKVLSDESKMDSKR